MTVVTHTRFVTPERLVELSEQGAEVNVDTILVDIDLPEPNYGEVILGTLSAPEAAFYIDLYKANVALEEEGRNMVGMGLAQIGNSIRQSDRNKPLSEVLRNTDLMGLASDDEAKHYFKLQQRAAMLHSVFYYNLGERFDAHEWRLGIRSRGRIVKIERR
jgi:hypothetical protein